MTSLTNLLISNAIKGTNAVSKIRLGNNLVWPKVPVFTFDTYQTGGTVDFEVTSDTGIIATVTNDNECRLHPVSQSNINTVRAQGSGYSRTYNVPSGTDVTNVSLPLFQRREVNITGRGTRSSRYNSDWLIGSLKVTITNDFSSSVTFSVQVGGITKTATIAGRTFTRIDFTGLSGGNKNVVITNITEGDTETVTVNINYGHHEITPIYYRFGAQSNEQSTSTKLTKVDVYALTEAEANASSSLFIAESRSAEITIGDLSCYLFAGGCWFFFEYSGWLYLEDRGIGYPPNATIDANPTTGHPEYFLREFYLQFRTDHNGSVREWRASLPKWSVYPDDNYRDWTDWSTGNKIRVDKLEIVPQFSYIGRGRWPTNRENDFNSITSGGIRIELYNIPPPPPATSVPADSLLFDGTDSLGNISTVSMKNVAVNSIKVQSQDDLVAVQTKSTGLYDDLISNKPAMLQSFANPNFNTLHGTGISYTYS